MRYKRLLPTVFVNPTMRFHCASNSQTRRLMFFQTQLREPNISPFCHVLQPSPFGWSVLPKEFRALSRSPPTAFHCMPIRVTIRVSFLPACIENSPHTAWSAAGAMPVLYGPGARPPMQPISFHEPSGVTRFMKGQRRNSQTTIGFSLSCMSSGCLYLQKKHPSSLHKNANVFRCHHCDQKAAVIQAASHRCLTNPSFQSLPGFQSCC